MKISKDECDKEFAEKKFVLSNEKCKQCEYLYLCPFMSHAMDEVTNGDEVGMNLSINAKQSEFEEAILLFMENNKTIRCRKCISCSEFPEKDGWHKCYEPDIHTIINPDETFCSEFMPR